MYRPLNTFLFRTPYFSFSALPDFEEKRCGSVFKEMLQIATPDLREGMDKGEDKAQYSAYRYYQRACTRPTPFGLFAGCSMGTAGERTEILLTGQKEYRRGWTSKITFDTCLPIYIVHSRLTIFNKIILKIFGYYEKYALPLDR